MPAGDVGRKGNPAAKRMVNANRKARRERSWLRGEKRKVSRAKAQDAAHARNQELRAQGLLTAWEEAKEARRERRRRKREAAA